MTTWTPRPPADEEPACWSWPVPPLRDRDAELDRLLAEQTSLPRDRQLSRSALEMTLFSMGSYRMDEFHAGRCAICGTQYTITNGLRLVDDHDHFTGLIRGRLCRSCNVREGVSRHEVFDRYREHHPAQILGVVEYYMGPNWPLGWWQDQELARRLTTNPRWCRVKQTR